MPTVYNQNKNLTLYNHNQYRNHQVQLARGPVFEEYLAINHQVIDRAIETQSKTFVVVLSVYFPAHWSLAQRLQRDHYSRMIESLKSQMKAFDDRAKKNGNYRPNRLRFIRTVEIGEQNQGLHAHMALIFDGNVYRNLGDPNSILMNMWWRIRFAWASALNLPVGELDGLIHISKQYYIDQRENEKYKVKASRQVNELLYHLSYFCKADTKHYGLGLRVYSPSRG